MIPILYGKEETDFTTNGQGRLTDAKSCIVTEERHGIYELELQYPINGIHYKDIELDSIIKAVPFDNGTPQLFTVYDFSRPINGIVTISACHISYRLRLIPLMPFTGNGIQDTFAKVKANALGECPFDFWTNIESERRCVLPYPDSIRGKLQGDQWSILQAYSGEYEFDNYTVKLWESRGSDKGQILRYGKNITNLKQDESIQNTITGIVPYWYGFVGEEQEVYYLPEKVLYSENVDNFPYKRTACIDFTEDFAEKPTEEELRTRGQKYISDNNIGVPSVSISLSFVDLSKTEEYEGKVPLTHINLCDTITVKFAELGVSTKAKVTRTKWNVLLGRYEEIYIGSTIHSLAQTIVDQGQAVEQVKGTTIPAATENAIKNAVQQSYYQAENLVEDQTALITGNSGGYVVLHDSNGDEEPDEILVMDTDNINTAQKVWRWNNAGLGYSSTGYQGPYITAWTIDGKFNADFIQTGVLSADLIKAGTLNIDRIAGHSVGLEKLEGSIINGSWKIDFTNGTLTIGNISADNITTGTLDASKVTVKNLIATILQAYNDAKTQVLEAKSGYLDIRQLVSNVWRQRIGLYVSSTSGFLRLSTGETNANGSLTGDGYQTFIGPRWMSIGTDKNGANTFFVNQNGDLEIKGNLSAANFPASSYLTVAQLWSGTLETGSITVSNGATYKEIMVFGQVASGTSTITSTIPILGLSQYDLAFQIADESYFYSFNVKTSGNDVVITYRSRNSTGKLFKVFGIK